MSEFEGTHDSFLPNPPLSVLRHPCYPPQQRDWGMLDWQKLDHQGQLLVMHRDAEMWVPPHSRAGLGSLWLWCQFAQVPTLHKELFAIISWSCWTELLPCGAWRYRPLQQPLQPAALILEFSASSKFWSTGGFPLFSPLLSECLTGGDGLRQAQATLHGKFFLCMTAGLNVLQDWGKHWFHIQREPQLFQRALAHPQEVQLLIFTYLILYQTCRISDNHLFKLLTQLAVLIFFSY